MDDAMASRDGEFARLQEENARLRRQLELSRTAYDYLVRLAHHFSGEEAPLDSPEQIRAFCERIKRSVGILVQEFRELLSGRRRFQLDYALRSGSQAADGGAKTQVFRLGDLHGDLGRFLFDWKNTSIDDASFNELKEAIDELKYHQLAILKGYEHCIKDGTLEVIKPLSPDVIRADMSARNGAGIVALLRKLNPFQKMALWHEYEKRYQELLAEDAGRLEAKVRPVFRQGYREVMRSRTGSRQAGPPSAGEGVE